MEIITTKHYENEWTAIDMQTYDGHESPVGYGDTKAAAISDLKEKICAHTTTDRQDEVVVTKTQ